VETNPLENTAAASTLLSQAKIDEDRTFPGNTLKFLFDFYSSQCHICYCLRTFSWETGLLTIAVFLKICLFVSLCITCVYMSQNRAADPLTRPCSECWELNLYPLQEHQVFLGSESSLALAMVFKFVVIINSF
jgi:hypothetical protein